MDFSPDRHPHRRFNALTGEWVLVSAQRTRRPWSGRQETPARPERPAHDPSCYLCPGNRRAGDAANPDYTDTFVFENDFPALLPDVPPAVRDDPLFRLETESGTCRVICFSPHHDLTLAEMPPSAIRKVVDVWCAQTEDLGRSYRWVQILENKGELMGASSPHPHGQIWAGGALPNEPAKEDARQKAWREEHQTVLLVEYLERERVLGERMVFETESFAVLVPFWAFWPFETLLLPKRHVPRLPDLTDAERDDLAVTLKGILTAYDRVFDVPFPYSFGWHGAPYDAGDPGHWQLHAHFLPPLLRSAEVRKFMAGYELLAELQRDITPETAAARLRELAQSA